MTLFWRLCVLVFLSSILSRLFHDPFLLVLVGVYVTTNRNEIVELLCPLSSQSGLVAGPGWLEGRSDLRTSLSTSFFVRCLWCRILLRGKGGGGDFVFSSSNHPALNSGPKSKPDFSYHCLFWSVIDNWLLLSKLSTQLATSVIAFPTFSQCALKHDDTLHRLMLLDSDLSP